MSALLIGGIPRRDIQARRRVHCSGYFQGTGGLFVCVRACVWLHMWVGWSYRSTSQSMCLS